MPRATMIVLKNKIVKGHGNLDEKVILARPSYIRAPDLEEHGMTIGCPKCDHFVKYQTCRSRPQSSLYSRADQNSGWASEDCRSV